MLYKHKLCFQWRFYIELLSGRDPLWAPPIREKKKHNILYKQPCFTIKISVRQAYISQLYKSFNRTFEKYNSAQNSISYQNLNILYIHKSGKNMYNQNVTRADNNNNIKY